MLPSLEEFTRGGRTGSKRRPDVLQIMSDQAAAILGHEHIERVAGFHVDEIGPGAEDLQRAQLAAMLVGNHIVRIVRPACRG